VDIECGACCEVGFTGITLAAHTCRTDEQAAEREELGRALCDLERAFDDLSAHNIRESSKQAARIEGARSLAAIRAALAKASCK